MPLTAEQRYRGGMTTYGRYGPEHYRLITKGRPKRRRWRPLSPIKQQQRKEIP